ncbi:potassium-transporting ATPase subunit KdpA [Thermoflavifilum thermophilum]|uniref:Potassium-transporting ATPase potassium-binding subunit n=1 Tax=Thermoflavifilum thermophilum TaxID=1393122 RepID=A0A1I7NM70_9BACT|nr:potassium-transporting ATPase subunit KdpA [Thermoflavifilum thermophilum]SFV35753.1 K+-transporting ATPase ATPase A chain [Thermoflavifilum thermophilum]
MGSILFSHLAGIVVTYLLTVFIGIVLGRYMYKVYSGDPTWSDTLFVPIEKLIFRVCRIHAKEEFDWKDNMKMMLSINLIWFIISMLLLTNMKWLPLNPNHISSMSPDLAFNTTISFLVNCDLQTYIPETQISYLGQIWLMFLQFVSAATGMAACILIFRAFREKSLSRIGNFEVYFVKSITRILLPLSLLLSIIFIWRGMPMNFAANQHIITLEHHKQTIAEGPVAAFVPIKHLGTNGGGFFNANSAHPFENPDYLTNMLEMIAQAVIPIGLIFTFGYFIRNRKLAWIIFCVMTMGFLLLVIPNVWMEIQGNPAIRALGIDNRLGNMEGKEVRLGTAASGYWSVITTVISTGSTNAMLGSYMPLSAMNMLLGMMVNAFYGGVGAGFINFFIYLILAVFIAGMMVGRTPEFMGKKIEAREMKIAALLVLLHPFLILIATAWAIYVYLHHPVYHAWIMNPGPHGFTAMLYEYTSAAANNGSAFAELSANNPWWNISTGIVLLLGRYPSIIGGVAIAGLLGRKQYVPQSAGTLRVDTYTFGVVLFAVIVIIAALSFFPALSLGPIAEYFLIH